jgi:lipoate---protein ligase
MTVWAVEHVVGSAAELFTGDKSSAALTSGVLTQPLVRVLQIDAPTLVLGSAQNESVVGVVPNVVKRRSGGGAVWLDPAEQVWVDVLLPTAHQRWDADVNRSFFWLGHAWIDTLRSVGVMAPLDMHTEGLRSTEWSSLLCFAGRGPGEVFANNRKVVGLAQRRGRAGALFQCGVLLKWTFDPQWFAPEAVTGKVDDVQSAGVGLDELLLPVPDPAEVVSALVDVLESTA